MSKADRLRVQDILHRLGYYKGHVDGVFGSFTRAAIRRFQHDIGAEMTGHLTADEASRWSARSDYRWHAIAFKSWSSLALSRLFTFSILSLML